MIQEIECGHILLRAIEDNRSQNLLIWCGFHLVKVCPKRGQINDLALKNCNQTLFGAVKRKLRGIQCYLKEIREDVNYFKPAHVTLYKAKRIKKKSVSFMIPEANYLAPTPEDLMKRCLPIAMEFADQRARNLDMLLDLLVTAELQASRYFSKNNYTDRLLKALGDHEQIIFAFEEHIQLLQNYGGNCAKLKSSLLNPLNIFR